MTRREWLLGAASCSMPAASGARPNVLLVMTDQQTGSAMSAAGNPWLRTPHLDRLASEGTRFANAWCTSPVCSPARGSLLTGMRPGVTGVEYNNEAIRAEVPTIGEVFRGAGYETVWAGKWHLPSSFPYLRSQPADYRGFTFLPFEMANPRLAPFGEFLDTPVVTAAAKFLRDRREKPFLLAVSLLKPHDICQYVSNNLPDGHPWKEHTDPPESELPPLPPNFDRSADEPEFINRCRERQDYGDEIRYTVSWDTAQWRRYLWTYYRLVERADSSIGVVLDALRDAGLEDNTIVVFTSDHGEGIAAHHWVVKLMLWQEVLTVPLIFRWPSRIAKRTDHGSLVSVMDTAPTLCRLAGIPPPKPMQGVSLDPLLEGRSGPRRTPVYADLAPDLHDRSLRGRAVRTGRYKYIRFSWGKNPEMLFDLGEDPGEQKNLALLPRYHKELIRHRALLAATANPG